MSKVVIDLSNMPLRQTSSEQQGSSAGCAQLIDLLRARVSILSGKDRTLMQMYLESGLTFGQMARVAGVNECTIARRIHKLTCLLLDSEYITCLRNRRRFSSLELSIARDHYFDDLGHKKIAKRRNVTVYQVRKTLRKIQELDRVSNNQNRIRHETKVRSE
jgi:predicted DNA-binding protein YlxM (UPF0122 family)